MRYRINGDKKLTPQKFLTQISPTSSKIIELDSFNEQPLTFRLQHYSKFRLILLFYDDIIY